MGFGDAPKTQNRESVKKAIFRQLKNALPSESFIKQLCFEGFENLQRRR